MPSDAGPVRDFHGRRAAVYAVADDGADALDEILQTLKKIGWQEDVVSLELFRPEYYKMDPDKVYRIGKEKSEAVIKRNF